MNLNRRPVRLGLFVFVSLLLGPQAKAEDSADSVVLSGLHAIPAHSAKVAAAAITLSHGTADVSISTQAEDAEAMIEVAGPEFRWIGEQDSYPDRQFPELQITVDHHSAILQDHSAASLGGTDITAQLKEAGIDLFSISQSPPVLFSTPENHAEFNRLLAMGAITQLAGQDVAAWSARRDVSFDLSEGAHLITLKYNARPAITLLPPEQLRRVLPLGAYCLSDAILSRAAARAAKSGYVLAVQYAIPAGIDGQAGAAVAIDLNNPGGKNLPANTAFFCAPDGKPVAAKNALVHAQAKPDASGVVHILTLGSAAGG